MDWVREYEKTIDYDFLYVYTEDGPYCNDEYDNVYWDTVIDTLGRSHRIKGLEWSSSECTKGNYYGQYTIPKVASKGAVEMLVKDLLGYTGVTEVSYHITGEERLTIEYKRG